VKGIELGETTEPEDKSPGKDEVVSMIVIPHGDLANCMVLTACVNGFGKRTPVEDYRLQRRGGSGVINIKTTERNGNVVGMKAVCDEDELMLITERGILMRTRVLEIRETGRNAAGVRLIRLDDGDKLVAMAKIDPEPDRPGEEGTSGPIAATGATGTVSDAPSSDGAHGSADGADASPDGSPDAGPDAQ
jgi:DNA gyrase subunit A